MRWYTLPMQPIAMDTNNLLTMSLLTTMTNIYENLEIIESIVMESNNFAKDNFAKLIKIFYNE